MIMAVLCGFGTAKRECCNKSEVRSLGKGEFLSLRGIKEFAVAYIGGKRKVRYDQCQYKYEKQPDTSFWIEQL
jgi:hypothetical protein